MNAPVFLLAGTGSLVVAAAFLHRRAGTSAILAGIGAGVLGACVLLLPVGEAFQIAGVSLKIDESFVLLGRSLNVDVSNRAQVGFLYLLAAFLFGGGWAAMPGRYFFSAGLVLLGATAASLMVRPFLYAAVFLEVAAMAGVLLLAAPGTSSRRGAQRLLIVYSVAMMAILLTGWMLEAAGVTGATPALARRTVRLLGLGFAVLLLVPPFHLWLTASAGRTPPYALALVVLVLYSAGLFFLLRFLDTYEWLRSELTVLPILRGVGVFMIFFGGVWSLAQRSMSKMVAYALLADLGVTLVALGIGSASGYQLSLGLSGARVVSLAVWALGISILLRNCPSDQASDLTGASADAPLATATMLVGAFSLSGLPLTAGFPGRWATMAVAADVSLLASLAVVFGILAPALATVRWLATLRLPGDSAVSKPAPLGLWERTFLTLGIGMCFWLGVFPQTFYPWVVQAASGLGHLVP